ncbi:uncharacterized protein LOC113374838 [Ctenocephalides felis]|uniref:uncharacterized protein LOC113374838 n=1 Tax=Ctenocephalides felis TaxID=7515 RepID=UPI000E6E335E|nr:uncharacterized protein LOC113374838 [Ctenocephalides felis]
MQRITSDFSVSASGLMVPRWCQDDEQEGCGADSQCLRCGPTGCIKCPVLIVEGSRACVDDCPSGRSASWSALPDYMGKVCLKTGPGGLSGAGLAVVIGACAGGVVCIIIITAGILIAKYRKRPQKKINSQRAEFLKELDRLRPQSLWKQLLMFPMIEEVESVGRKVAQLINFLQSPSYDDKAIQTSVTTFKPSNGFGSALSLQDFVEPFSDGNTTLLLSNGNYERMLKEQTPAYGPGGLSGAGLAVVIGACAGGVVCLIIITAGILIAKYRKRPQKKINSQRAEFLKELDRLRPQSYCLLAILNDIRRQIREVHANGDTTAALTYWPVVRDLAKLLYLLNRPVETIVNVPNDWKKLNQWAEKLITRYKHISNESQPQVAQLINFLQSPSYDDKAIQTSVTTFKPSNGFGSALSLQDFVEPFSDGNTITAEQWQLRTNAEGADTSLWLEDECFQLGLRPQDEITTEL